MGDDSSPPDAGPWNWAVCGVTAGKLFQGTASGELAAYCANDGTKPWSDSVPRGIGAAPMTSVVGGRPYLSVLVSGGGSYPLVARELAFKSGRMVSRSHVLTYAIDGTPQLPALSVAVPPGITSVQAEPLAQYRKWLGFRPSVVGRGARTGCAASLTVGVSYFWPQIAKQSASFCRLCPFPPEGSSRMVLSGPRATALSLSG